MVQLAELAVLTNVVESDPELGSHGRMASAELLEQNMSWQADLITHSPTEQLQRCFSGISLLMQPHRLRIASQRFV
jgi:hypothetical protein